MSARAEKLLFRANASGRLRVCLAYPNRYAVAMGNLGFQAVYRLFATLPDTVCERLFLPDDVGEHPATLESSCAPADFHILAFSLSFESDYPNIIRLLDSAGIPARAEDRRNDGRAWPLLVAGGPATFLNPEPIAPFFDAFLIGEGEEMIVEAFGEGAELLDRPREEWLARIGTVAGSYLPQRYVSSHDAEGHLTNFVADDRMPPLVVRRYVADLDANPVTTSVVAPDAVFGDYYLVEASRGCEWGCRFCAAGFMYRPVRHRASASVEADALAGLEHANTIGLVGAEMASHPGITGTCERVRAAGGRVSPSSLKADVINPRLARALAASGTRSVTVAPEAGSERMRRVINKNLSESEILRAVDLMVGDGVESLKLYFMCALPTETIEDLDGIVDLVAKVRERMIGHGRARGRVGRIKVSVNPFVPKPWTPFQWDAMVPVAEAQRRLAYLRRAFGRMSNVEMESESPREAYLQTLFSRGDRRVAAVVEALARNETGWWQQIQDMRRGRHETVALDPDFFVTREYGLDEKLPWDFIDHRIDPAYLRLERRRAHAERETEPCDVATCHSCKAC